MFPNSTKREENGERSVIGKGWNDMDIIARIHTDFSTKFGLPRQSGLVEELKGRIIFEPAYRQPEAFRGLEEFSHIWVIWQFSESRRKNWSATVAPPRLGGRERMGVFATRSPFRPNDIGLSCVRLEKIEWDEQKGPVLCVSGIDMVDNTPVYDIKPYIPYADCHPEASEGFTGRTKEHALKVDFPPELLCQLPESKRDAIVKVLREDPRPAYDSDPDRLYGVAYAGWDVRFRVKDKKLTVYEVEALH